MQKSNETSDCPDSVDAEVAALNRKAWRDFTLLAYGRFHDAMEAMHDRHPEFTPFAAADRAGKTSGTFAWWWGAEGEIRETINTINAWAVRLHEWAAWNDVIESFRSDEDRWDVLAHFAEPVAFFCMLQPSSLSDRLALTAENTIHQANRRLFPGEPDRLDQDERPGKHLRRSDRRRQLARLGERWPEFPAFMQASQAVDGEDYRKLTRNFRDLASHSFSPRFMTGYVQRTIRSIAPIQEMVQLPDGNYREQDHPTKKGISYAMHSLEPLPLDVAYEANLAEYRRAHLAMRNFATLVDALCDRIDLLPPRGPNQF